MAKTKNRNNTSKPRELIVDPNDIIENKPTPAEIYKEAERDIINHQVKKAILPHIAVEGRDYTTITTVEVQEVTVSELREAVFGIDGLDDKYLQESVVDVINQRLADMGSPIFEGFYQNTQDATVTRVYAEVVNSVLGERITYATIQKVDEDLSREMTVSNIKLPDESYRVHLLSAVDYVKANDLQISGEQYQKRIAKAIQEMRKEHSMAQENQAPKSSAQVEVENTPVKTEVEIKATENKTLVAHTEAGDITADSVTVTLSPCKIKPVFKRARNSNGTYTLVAMRGEGDMTPPREFILKVLRLVWVYQEYHAISFDEVLFKDDAMKTGLRSQLTDAEARQAVGVKKGKGLFDDPLNPCNIEDVIVHDDYVKIVNPNFENDASIFEVA